MKLHSILILGLVLSACASTDNTQKQNKDPNAKHDKNGRQPMGPITSVSSGAALIISFNRNEDYAIDQVEFAAGRESAFKIADGDESGSIDLFEFRHWHPKAMGSANASPGSMYFDKNFDNRITKEEFDLALSNLFASSDKNGDGLVAIEELVNVISRPGPRGSEKSRPKKQEGGRGKGGRGGGGRRGG